MKQIIQDLKSGETILEEIPIPIPGKGQVLIKTHRSLVSLGTEKMLVNFGKSNYIQKARQQPEKVKQVLQKIKSDGLKPTVEAVFRKLNEPLPLGYCNAGEVVEVGEGVNEFKVGDRVISNGGHAEYVSIPENLVAKIPDELPYEEAVFTVIGAIALQGVRLLQPQYSATVVVTGLGLIGLITVQILKANGCRVIGLDFDQRKVEIAKSYGVDAYAVSDNNNPVSIVTEKTKGIGCDGVIITASTPSNDVISQAAEMSRKRGKIILVGVIGLNIKRSDFYEKELTFQVSCSYGPGRYDTNYEQKGLDYPIEYVRWTEKRNFEAVLNSIANKSINLKSLITERVPLADYNKIYSNLSNSKSIASILEYPDLKESNHRYVTVTQKDFTGKKAVLGIIGAGNFTKSTILPVLKKLNANLKYICSAGGLSAKDSARKYKIARATTDLKEVLQDDEVNTVILTTRHNLHASQVISSLKAGKNVFVEKPLALSIEELKQIKSAYDNGNSSIMIGFNRRFSPHIVAAKKNINNANVPISVIATMNAGAVPKDHWVQDMSIGGGRIIGEACHYIDLISHLTGDAIESVYMQALGQNPKSDTDNASLILKYKNGSLGIINYLSTGSKSYSKERIEVFDSGRNIIIDNFRSTKFYGYKQSNISGTQDKGHLNQFKSFIKSVEEGTELIPFDSLYNTTLACFGALESLTNKKEIFLTDLV